MDLIINNISKQFKDNVVLENVNMKLKGNNIYGFIGRNGSGKSVLLKIICGFYSPTSGWITLNGDNYLERKSFPKDTRALIERPCFLPELSGLDNLKLLASIQNKIDEKEILRYMKMLNLDKDIYKKYNKYSLGTKQKLGIVQVLMESPNLIILDEPFNGIEEKTVRIVKKMLLEEKNKGKIIIIASHIKDDILDLADDVFEFDNSTVRRISSKKWKK